MLGGAFDAPMHYSTSIKTRRDKNLIVTHSSEHLYLHNIISNNDIIVHALYMSVVYNSVEISYLSGDDLGLFFDDAGASPVGLSCRFVPNSLETLAFQSSSSLVFSIFTGYSLNL